MPVILIVSDSRSDDAQVQVRLRAEGYHTLSVNDVASALETLNCIRADVLVIDTAGIDQRTIALLERLRDHQDYKAMPVFFIGARGGDGASAGAGASTGAGASAMDFQGPTGAFTRMQPLEDVLTRVRGHVEPMSVPYN